MSADGGWPIVRFIELAMGLKRVRRQGWLDRGVRDAESVADHSWAVALLAWSLAGERDDLDRERVLLLALAHDLPEALAGDTTPFDVHRDVSGAIPRDHFGDAPAYSPQDRVRKRDAEAAALEEMLAGAPDALRRDLWNAWREYEEARSPEARFVKQVDKLETVMQAELYQRAQPEVVVESFRRGARRDISDPQLRALLDAVRGPD